MKLTQKSEEALEEKRQENYKVILAAFLNFVVDEKKKKEFVDGINITDIYIDDIYPYDLLAVGLDYCHKNLSSQLIYGCLTIMDTQMAFIEMFIHKLTALKDELVRTRETGEAKSLQEFLLQRDSHYKSYCEKYGYNECIVVDHDDDDKE